MTDFFQMNSIVGGFLGIAVLIGFLVFWSWLGRIVAGVRGQSPTSGTLVGFVCALGILFASRQLHLPLFGFLGSVMLLSICAAAGLLLFGLLPPHRGTFSLRRLRESGEIDSAILEFDGTDVTDFELAQLAGNQTIEELRLGATRITDSGVTYLAQMDQLRHLDLSLTQITDASLVTISRLTNLQRLWLGGTSVTDAGLPHLAALRQLEELYLANTRVTQAGVNQLVAMLAGVKIDVAEDKMRLDR